MTDTLTDRKEEEEEERNKRTAKAHMGQEYRTNGMSQ